jgi:YidC/Oxa1 family membrane protein insertase
MQPIINVLVALSHYLFSSFGLTIIALTIIIRGLMYPLTIKQLRSTKAMQALQPKMAELQKKYAKDKNKLAKEQMKLYKESGVSPAGCLVPMLIQMPVWIALYQAIIKVMGTTPENFLGLSGYLYSWPIVYSVLPLNNSFLGMELSSPNFILALLVGASMWVQQKMVTPVTADPRQQSQSRLMLWMMPMLFFFFSLNFPSGLALYWVASNIISIVMQYFVTGWGSLVRPKAAKQVTRDKKYKKRIAEVEQAPVAEAVEADITSPQGENNGRDGDKRQDSGGGYPKSLRAVRRQPQRGRGHHPKRR